MTSCILNQYLRLLYLPVSLLMDRIASKKSWTEILKNKFNEFFKIVFSTVEFLQVLLNCEITCRSFFEVISFLGLPIGFWVCGEGLHVSEGPNEDHRHKDPSHIQPWWQRRTTYQLSSGTFSFSLLIGIIKCEKRERAGTFTTNLSSLSNVDLEKTSLNYLTISPRLILLTKSPLKSSYISIIYFAVVIFFRLSSAFWLRLATTPWPKTWRASQSSWSPSLCWTRSRQHGYQNNFQSIAFFNRSHFLSINVLTFDVVKIFK